MFLLGLARFGLDLRALRARFPPDLGVMAGVFFPGVFFAGLFLAGEFLGGASRKTTH